MLLNSRNKNLTISYRGLSNNHILALSNLLGNHVKSLESLHLRLNFDTDSDSDVCYVTDDSVLDLAYQIGGKMTVLQNLYLHFGEYPTSKFISLIYKKWL